MMKTKNMTKMKKKMNMKKKIKVMKKTKRTNLKRKFRYDKGQKKTWPVVYTSVTRFLRAG